jgi:hypothetical protein
MVHRPCEVTQMATELIDGINQQLSGERVQRISDRIGADPQRTRAAIDEALPILVGALGAEAQDPHAAPGLQRALAQDHNGALLDELDDYLDGRVSGRQADGNGILEHVLGDRRPAAEQALASKSGLDLSSIGPLLVTLAPIVMNMLGRRQQHAGGLGLDDLLGSLLGGGGAVATGPRSQAQGLDDLLGSVLGGSRTDR